jgi:hypothetical protein
MPSVPGRCVIARRSLAYLTRPVLALRKKVTSSRQGPSIRVSPVRPEGKLGGESGVSINRPPGTRAGARDSPEGDGPPVNQLAWRINFSIGVGNRV